MAKCVLPVENVTRGLRQRLVLVRNTHSGWGPGPEPHSVCLTVRTDSKAMVLWTHHLDSLMVYGTDGTTTYRTTITELNEVLGLRPGAAQLALHIHYTRDLTPVVE